MDRNGAGNAAAGPAAPVPAPPTGPWMIDNCINLHGWGFLTPDDVDGRRPTTFFCEMPPSSRLWEEEAKAILAQGKSPWRSSFRLTDEEKAPFRGWAAKVLLVGFAVTGLGPDQYKAPPGSPKVRPGGDTMTPQGFWVDPPVAVPNIQEKKIVPVDTRLEHHDKQKADLFALLRPAEPRTGLCRMYRAVREECFCLPLFRFFDRQNNKGANGRSVSWNARVRKHCVALHGMPLAIDVPWDARPDESRKPREPRESRMLKEADEGEGLPEPEGQKHDP